jgi:hydrogenase nickel incorporation protein HypA/HybF
VHELSIAEAVCAQISERLPDATIAVVRLRIGELSGVVPEAVEFCFEAAAHGTVVEGARLEIETVPGRCRCRDCGREFRPDDLILLCTCGSARVTVLAGEDLQIGSVETVEHV